MPIPTGASPLAALKQWLAIATPQDDALLERLLVVANQTCGQFVGSDALPLDWADVPPALNEGIIRCAAHLYRDRDSAAETAPPAAVGALWRPFRAVRL